MKRNQITYHSPVLFILRVAIVLTLAALSAVTSVAAQSSGSQNQNSNSQNQNSTQPAEAGEQDLINPDRPGIADGSAVIGPRRVQLESGIQEEYRRDGDTREHTFFVPTLLRIGINNRWEARIEGNTFTRTITFDPAAVTDHSAGLSPTSLGVKYHIQDSKGVRHPSLGAIARVFPAWGSGNFRTEHVTGDLRLAADWDFAPQLKLSLNPNVGVGRYEDNQGKTFAAWLFAVTLNYLPTKKLNPFIDMGLQAPEESDGKSSVIFDTGVAYIVGRNVQLDVSVGNGAHGNTPPRPFVSVGVSLRSRSNEHRK